MVAFAWSGGGITAIICTMCAQYTLDGSPLLATGFNASLQSTVSGGSVGHALYGTTSDKLWFPNYTALSSSPQAYDLISSKNHTDALPYWYGEVLKYIPYTLNLSSLLALLRILGVMPSILGKKNWWELVLEQLFKQGYGADSSALRFRGSGTYMNWGLLREKKCPIERDSDGVIKKNGAASALYSASTDVTTGTTTIYGGQFSSLKDKITPLDAVSASSSFWNVAIVEGSSIEFDALSGWLNKYTASSDSGSETVFSMDGGLVDTTGIMPHLRAQEKVIVAFYNNNDDLTTLNSTFAYLFGMGTTTDTMNLLEGPSLAQVFDAALYAGFIANLTDGNVLRARLHNVTVRANSYLGVSSYVLDTLLVVSNQYSSDFLASFDDTRVPGGVESGWPNNMPVGFDVYNSNMLCLYSQWKMIKYAAEIGALLG